MENQSLTQTLVGEEALVPTGQLTAVSLHTPSY